MDLNNVHYDLPFNAIAHKNMDLFKFCMESGFSMKGHTRALIEACFENDAISVFYELIDLGLKINHTALKIACCHHLIPEINYILDSNKVTDHSKINECLFEVETVEVIKILQAHGADIHSDDGQLIVDSIGNGKVEIVEYLLESGFDVNGFCGVLDGINDSYFIRAFNNNQLGVVKLLIERGADTSDLDFYQMIKTCLNIKSPAMFEFVKELAPEDTFICEHESLQELICDSCALNQLPIFKYLIKNYLSFMDCMSEIIMNAITDGDLEAERIKYVISLKDELDLDLDLEYLISSGADNCNLDVVKYFCSIGVDPFINNNHPLRTMSYSSHLPGVKYLVELGADPLEKGLDENNNPFSAVSFSVIGDSLEVFEYFFEKLKLDDGFWLGCLDMANSYGSKKVILFLKEKGFGGEDYDFYGLDFEDEEDYGDYGDDENEYDETTDEEPDEE